MLKSVSVKVAEEKRKHVPTRKKNKKTKKQLAAFSD